MLLGGPLHGNRRAGAQRRQHQIVRAGPGIVAVLVGREIGDDLVRADRDDLPSGAIGAAHAGLTEHRVQWLGAPPGARDRVGERVGLDRTWLCQPVTSCARTAAR